MNAILAIPLVLRLLLLFAVGAAVGGLANLGVYRLAWNRRLLSPWSASPKGRTPRWLDRVPLLGWWSLRRESKLHGAGFWLRPAMVELLLGLAFAGLYYWETVATAPRWMVPGQLPPPQNFLAFDLPLMLHARFASHLVLITLMLVASLIDVDEKSIPDTITIPGTLLGLSLAALYPWTLLPSADWLVGKQRAVEFLTFASPHPWPAWLDGLPLVAGLATALGCWTLWCVGLLPRRWNTRHGLRTAVRVLVHRLRVERITYRILPMWLVGAVAIVAAAWQLPQEHWAGLLTALVGMAAGGGIIWAIRIIGKAALKREAMGFGDVTLMSMIGAFVGWQAALVVFFLAPFAGLVIGVVQWVLHRDNEIPYGPFLCLATLGVLLNWRDVWDRTADIFALAWLLVALMVVCLGLMAVMLVVYRGLRERLLKG